MIKSLLLLSLKSAYCTACIFCSMAFFAKSKSFYWFLFKYWSAILFWVIAASYITLSDFRCPAILEKCTPLFYIAFRISERWWSPIYILDLLDILIMFLIYDIVWKYHQLLIKLSFIIIK